MGLAARSVHGTATPTGFQRTIAPILERCCTKCHNPDKKKGELLMTTPEGLQAGGENARPRNGLETTAAAQIAIADILGGSQFARVKMSHR